MTFVKVTYTKTKSYKWLKIFPIIIIVIILSAIIVGLLSAYAGLTIISPPKKPLYYFSANVVPEYKDVSFKDINKLITLRGWYFTTPKNTKTVILAHGYGKNRFNFEEQSLEMIKTLLSNGYNVLAFDLRNSGKSDGKQFTLGYYEKDDVLGAISFVKSQGIDKVSLLGFSTGANAVLLAAGKNISSVDAVIADTPYFTPEGFLQDSIFNLTKLPAFPFSKLSNIAINMLIGIDISDINTSLAVARVGAKPFMLICSSRDTIVPLADSRKLFAAYKNAQGISGQIWETSADGHANSFPENSQEYMDKLLQFLNSVYAAGSPKK